MPASSEATRRTALKSLFIRVKPGAKVSELGELADGTWVARLKAPPVAGKANAELLGLVARHFGQPKSRVSLKRGATGRLKTVLIADD